MRDYVPYFRIQADFYCEQMEGPLSKDNRVSVAVILLTGVGERPGGVQVLVENSRYLRVTILWPAVLTNVPLLMGMWLDGEEYQKWRTITPWFKDSPTI